MIMGWLRPKEEREEAKRREIDNDEDETEDDGTGTAWMGNMCISAQYLRDCC